MMAVYSESDFILSEIVTLLNMILGINLTKENMISQKNLTNEI